MFRWFKWNKWHSLSSHVLLDQIPQGTIFRGSILERDLDTYIKCNNADKYYCFIVSLTKGRVYEFDTKLTVWEYEIREIFD